MDLQKQRFFEDLTAKYWNVSLKGDCSGTYDDSEGITLDSLGGIFIATIVGLRKKRKLSISISKFGFLVIAMLVLVGEVYYYKRRAMKKKKTQTSELKVVPYKMPKILPLDFVEGKNNSILLGPGDFIPVAAKPRLSYFPSRF